MDIYIPTEIKHYEPELRLFFDLMVRKLHICREKGFAEDCDVSKMFKMLESEVDELDHAITDESQFDAVMESVDVANQAWLLALVTLRASRAEFEKQRQEYVSKAGKNPQDKNVKTPPGYGNKSLNPETLKPFVW